MADAKDPTEEERAALIISDLLASSLQRITSPHDFLYEWERSGLAWLERWRGRSGSGMISLWTAMFVRHGPPSWTKRGIGDADPATVTWQGPDNTMKPRG